MRNRVFLALLAPLVVLAVAQAHGPGPKQIPLERLLENMGKQVKARPQEAEGHYLLGRLHYFAFVAPQPKPGEAADSWRPAGHVGIYGEESSFYFDDSFGGDDPGKSRAPGPSSYARSPQRQIEHIRLAVTHLSKALALHGDRARGEYASQTGLVELGLACALEDGAALASKVGSVAGLRPTARAWRDAAIASYRLAYERASPTDLGLSGARFGKLVSEEAGLSYQRLVTERGGIGPDEARLLAAIGNALAKFAELPRAITPIVFSLTPRTSLNELLAPERSVGFAIDGAGGRAVGWVRPDTAILVWDPEGAGKIDSGVQLFGSATWWMFWSTGYDALGALDDDGDRWLTGRELAGLALWFDRNQNGISDAGEVVPIGHTKIEGIATRATGHEGISPMNPAGLRLRGGQCLPTWDWVAPLAACGHAG